MGLQSYRVDEVIVIGSGNWGLALACLFAEKYPIRVWTLNEQIAEQLNASRQNPGKFFKHPIPDSIVVEPKYSSQFDETRTLIILAVPSGQIALVSRELSSYTSRPLILSVAKGFDVERQCTMSGVIKGELPGATVVVLSGPTIANEVAEGKPTRAVLACEDLTTLAMVKKALANRVISLQVSCNPAHHEICAALKGIVAIAVGMAEALEMGCNAKGVIITEGIKELAEVAAFFGIPQTAAYGISGSADLIATCLSSDSRNVRLGRYLAEGNTLQQALDKVGMAVEGVAMSRTIETLLALDVSIPLIHFVNRAIQGGCRDIRAEIEGLIAVL